MATPEKLVGPLHAAAEGVHLRVASDVCDGRDLAAALPEVRSAARPRVFRAFSFPVLLGALLVVVVLIGFRLRLRDPDTWWHITVGQHILTTRTWPTSDVYSFTVRGQPWMAYEWFGEIFIALAARAGGLQGLMGLQIGLVGILVLLLYYYCYLRCRNAKAAFVATALLLPIAAGIFSLRPQLLGYVFILLTLIILERFREGHTRALWALPPLFLIWVNTHGTFALGLMILGLYWVSGLMNFRKGGLAAEAWTRSQRLQLEIIFLLSTLALLVTPYGSRLAAYPLEIATSQPVNVANIQEWQPIFSNAYLGKLFLGLVLVYFLTQVMFRWNYRLEEIGLLLFTAYAACIHLRFVLFFALVFAPMVAVVLARWVPQYVEEQDRYVLNLALMALLVVGLVRFFPSAKELESAIAEDYPKGAVDYLREHPQPGPMFNEYRWGGYLIWQLGPEHKVFIDGRTDIYEYAGVFSDYLEIMRLERDTPLLLRKYGVQSCLIESKAPLATYLAAAPGWREVYTDKDSALFVRKPETNQHISAASDGMKALVRRSFGGVTKSGEGEESNVHKG